MGVRIDVSMTNNLGRSGDEIFDGLQMGVTAAAMRLLALSAERVPLDLGTLMGTGSVSAPIGGAGADAVAEVVYDTPYAAKLHEHPEYNFQNGRQGKYVEEPALEHRQELGDIIRQAVRGG